MRYVGDASTLYPANDTGALTASRPSPSPPEQRTALAQRER